MKLDTVKLVCFSPTQTTKRVLEGIADGLASPNVMRVDLTLPGKDVPDTDAFGADLVVIGAPVYAGRIPPTAMERLRALHGQDTPAVLVVVYGNRAFEDALLELSDWAQTAGFMPVAGAAFIGEHSFNTPSIPIAPGRPDDADLQKAADFGRTVRQHLVGVSGDAALTPVVLPGNRPYRERHQGEPMAPVTHADLCTLCGLCAEVCPTAAITVGDAVVTDAEACILCCACVKACPEDARVMENEGLLRTARWLSSDHGARKEPEVFV